METLESNTRIGLQNILFATDFSTSSEMAMHYALAIARRYDSKIFVAHVIRPDAYQLVPAESQPTVMGQARRYAEQEMANVLISGRLRGIPHQVLLGQGEMWSALSEMLEKHEINLIVVGTHGRTGVRKLLLGSVAEQIFRLAHCPVLTVGPKVTRAPAADLPGETDLRQIVYATDFTVTSERAAAYAISLAQEHQARLTLVHAVRDASEFSPHNTALLVEFFTKRLRELLPATAESWCEPECVVEFGAPDDMILKVAADRSADLIVIGVRRSATFPGHLPPATAYKVVCQAHCPVLTVRG
jgi:nucleotide-binding universal stress UspA family protein